MKRFVFTYLDDYPACKKQRLNSEHAQLEFQSPQRIISSQNSVNVENTGNFDIDMDNITDNQQEPMEIDFPPLQNNTHERILARLGKSSPYGNCFFGLNISCVKNPTILCTYSSLSISICDNESGELLIRRAIVNFIRCFVSLGERERNYIDQIWPIQEAYGGNLQYYLVKKCQSYHAYLYHLSIFLSKP